jgi:tetratricopeptide (TPR) repeat protein
MNTKNYLLVLGLSIPAFVPSVTLAMNVNTRLDREPAAILLAQYGSLSPAQRQQEEIIQQGNRYFTELRQKKQQQEYEESERVRLLATKLEGQRDYIGLGDLYATHEQTSNAARAYQAAIAANPRSTIGYISLGNFWLTQGKLEESISSFNAAISIDSNSFDAHFGRARAKNKKGDIAGAVADYSQSINISPDAAPYYNRALIKKYKLNDKIGAIQDFRQAARLYRLTGATDKVGHSISHLQDLGATE